MTDTAITPHERETGTRAVYVLPGDVRFAAVPTRFTTILGSCVAVCLFDGTTGIGGINHYLLPGEPPDGERDRLRWSGPSLDTLVDRTLAGGASRQHLQAKVFGGASISTREVPEHLRIGHKNIVAALAFLEQARIPVVSHDVGGHAGRKIIFDADSGAAWVKLLAARPP